MLGSGIVLDDIIDEAYYRKGLPTWTSLENNNKTAAYESSILITASFRLFHQLYKQRRFYDNLLKLMLEVNFVLWFRKY